MSWMNWKPEGEQRGGIQYMRNTHTHIGAHETVIGGRVLTLLPDGDTSTRKRRSDLASYLADRGDSLAAVIGDCILAGYTNLLLDGEPLLGSPEPSGIWRLDLANTGEVKATWLAH